MTAAVVYLSAVRWTSSITVLSSVKASSAKQTATLMMTRRRAPRDVTVKVPKWQADTDICMTPAAEARLALMSRDRVTPPVESNLDRRASAIAQTQTYGLAGLVTCCFISVSFTFILSSSSSSSSTVSAATVNVVQLQAIIGQLDQPLVTNFDRNLKEIRKSTQIRAPVAYAGFPNGRGRVLAPKGKGLSLELFF